MITGILHTTFLTADLSKSRAFYEDMLGLRPDQNRPTMSYDGVWYDIAPNQQIHLMVLPDPEKGLARPPRRAGGVRYHGTDRAIKPGGSGLYP